jgi:hypothetical protein
MDARTLFGVLVRAVGLWYTACALGPFVYVVFRVTGHPPNTTHTLTGDVCTTLSYLAIGAALLFGGDWVARRLYPQR